MAGMETVALAKMVEATEKSTRATIALAATNLIDRPFNVDGKMRNISFSNALEIIEAYVNDGIV